MWWCWLWLVVSAAGGVEHATREVRTRYGALRGVVRRGSEVYLGVPYAAPPIGALRFMPPVSPSHWPGVRRCDRSPPVCPQSTPPLGPPPRAPLVRRLLPLLRNQSEDCLYLNLFLPDLPSGTS
ncbi:NLG-2 [Cordylochernes scorpioides]|uniref:NLG-2 n=1 Tax=Cordylochernes scorpioides TaxID=51811 RepID=A0ABY6LN80_9ARAC|nr:NLG-2 [Cordylochernes scorpioides]